MKVKVTIEEVISQTFEVEVTSEETAYEEIRQMYKNEELVLDNAALTQANVLMGSNTDPDNDGDWVDLHVS